MPSGTVKVVDASVVAAILFDEAEMETAVALLKDCDLIAPRLLSYEIINVAITKARRNPALSAMIEQALSKFEALGIKLLDVDTNAVYQIASATGLTGYDASYLWLSRTQNAELATFDKQLLQAAAR